MRTRADVNLVECSRSGRVNSRKPSPMPGSGERPRYTAPLQAQLLSSVRFHSSPKSLHVMTRRILISPQAWFLNKDVKTIEKENAEFWDTAMRLHGNGNLNYAQIKVLHKIVLTGGNSGRHAKFGPGCFILVPVDDQNSIVIRTGIEPHRLRTALLYWDRIELPKSSCGTNFTYDSHELEIATEEGIIERPVVELSDDEMRLSDVFIDIFCHQTSYQSQSIIQDATTPAQDLYFRRGLIEGHDAGESIDLQSKLPIPSEDVRVEELIEFKERYRDEFERFKSSIENIRTSDSLDGAKKYAHNFQDAIDVIDRLMDENRIKRFLKSWTVDLRAPTFKTILEDLIKASASVGADFVATGGLGFTSLILSVPFLFISPERSKYGDISYNFRYLTKVKEDIDIKAY